MNKFGEYITYDDEFLGNVMTFIMRYQLLEIDQQCLILENLNTNEQLESLFSTYLSLDIVDNPQIIIPKKMEIKEIVTIANDILISNLPSYKKEILSYDDLIYFYDDFSISDSCFNYQLSDDNKIIPDTIDLSSNLSEYTVGAINHEKIHALVFEKVILNKFPGIYMELFSMFFQKITNYIVESKINSNQTTIIDSIIRATDNQQHINMLDILREINLINEPTESNFIYNYFNLKGNDYLLSDWYSDLLFKYYLLDPQKMMKKINQVFKNEITIQDLLDYYQISLSNNELFACVENKLKEVKKYTIKP